MDQSWTVWGGRTDWCGSSIAGYNDLMSDKEGLSQAFTLQQNTFHLKPSDVQFRRRKCLQRQNALNATSTAYVSSFFTDFNHKHHTNINKYTRHQKLQDFPSFDNCQYQSLSKQPFLTKISPKKKKNQFDYERAHTHSSCYLATNKALLVIAVPWLAKKMDKACSAITQISKKVLIYILTNKWDCVVPQWCCIAVQITLFVYSCHNNNIIL